MTATRVDVTSLTVTVSEVFGPTVQGEGPSAGRRCAFVRLGRCNLSCSWCDTPYSWDWTRYDPAVELTTVPVTEVVQQVNDMDVPLVVITGGEPMLQRRALTALATDLAPNHRVEVETNGTQSPWANLTRRVHYNVSPKLPHAGMPVADTIVPDVLREFNATGCASLKWVCQSPEDVDHAADWTSATGWDPSDVWIMPEGATPGAQAVTAPLVADRAVAYGFNISPRLHVNLWGDTRGR